MVASPLVAPESGQTVVDMLDAADMSPAAAFWRYLPESSEWRLILALDLVETSGKLATYQKVQNVLKGHDVITLNDITVVGPRDNLVAGLRRALRLRGDARTPIRVTSTPVDGTFVEDALVYRL